MLISNNGTQPSTIVSFAIIGTQHIIHAYNALAFAIRVLSDGWPIEAALVEGCKAIVSRIGMDQPDWTQPVLYMCALDGQFFKATERERV